MRTLRAWLVRVIGFVRPRHGEQDFADELQSHIELQIADHERKCEMGIRLALGASPRGLVGLLIRQAVMLAAAEVGGGIGIALALSPLVASQLFGIGAADPVTIAGVAGVLLAVALLAAAIPASRVMRVDPVSTLRCD